jgi:hypothetical protein
MRGRTRPSIIFGTLDEAGSHRIAFNIANGCPGVRLVQNARKRASLPYMAAKLVLPIEFESILSMALSGDLRKCVFLLGNGHEMNVIRHEAIGLKAQSVTVGIISEQFKVKNTVSVVAKYVGSPNATLCDVMGSSGTDNASPSRHGSPSVKRKRPLNSTAKSGDSHLLFKMNNR